MFAGQHDLGPVALAEALTTTFPDATAVKPYAVTTAEQEQKLRKGWAHNAAVQKVLTEKWIPLLKKEGHIT